MSIVRVESGKGLNDFINAPNNIYSNDPFYVPQLNLERRMHLSKKNPYFKHARVQYFVAYKDGKPIGRISAQIDSLAQKTTNRTIGHFGFLDAADTETASRLLQESEKWLLENNATKIIGPYSLSINDESGLLVEGFDSEPRMMMNHTHPWMGSVIEKNGYYKTKDLIAFNVSITGSLPERARRIAAKALDVAGVTERPLNARNIKNDLKAILGIFNDAWSDNWGFVPMTEDEIVYVAESMRPLIQPELARIIEVNGHAIAMIVALPDFNQALKGLNGKIMPFGWLKILWRLKIQGLTRSRVLLMGVKKEYRGSFEGTAFAALLMERLMVAMQKAGFTEVEMSWILEDNFAVIRLIESVGGKAYKRYRLYEKDLA